VTDALIPATDGGSGPVRMISGFSGRADSSQYFSPEADIPVRLYPFYGLNSITGSE